MGSFEPISRMPIVEIGQIQEIFFTDIEIEIFQQRFVRFLLISQHKPPDCEASAVENCVRAHCTTVIDLVPAMIRKTVFALGKHWGRDAVRGLLLPL